MTIKQDEKKEEERQEIKERVDRRTYTEVWVVYVYRKSAYSCFPPETFWEKFATKAEADVWYKRQVDDKNNVEVEEPRAYKLFVLDPVETYKTKKKGVAEKEEKTIVAVAEELEEDEEDEEDDEDEKVEE